MSQSSPQVGFLSPLCKNSKEEIALPKLTICKGPNFVGRNCIPVTDKRLSRKHIMIEASSDGSADIIVEGSNPVVVSSQGQRNKILSQERTKIRFGDIIELIPGYYFYEYVPLAVEKITCSPGDKKRTSTANLSCEMSDSEVQDMKKKRRASHNEAQTSNFQSEQDSSLEAIRHFNILKKKLASTFRLLRVQGLPAWANTSSVSISDVIQGDVQIAVLSNYMVDVDWLISACPSLKRVPHVLVVHGESDALHEHVKRHKLVNWNLHKPPLPISYGTHHSKAMFLVYPRGVRIIVHTANLIHVDWNNKSQGLWVQDFPWKDQSNPSNDCGFETDLFDYLNALKWPAFEASLPGRGDFYVNASFFKKFDYSSAAVRLIGSVPGYHNGPNLKKWGHIKLRTILQDCVFDKKFQKSPLVYQFSSLGSLDDKWMAEFASSLSSGLSEDRTPLGLGGAQIIWPAVEDVRCSLEGYAAGSAIPSPLKNVEKGFLNKYWAKWKATHTGRCRAMPHIKTFTRYSGQELAWFLLTSANLSKAAWGALQKNNTQLMIRSYELGVLFLPSKVKHGHVFSCTDDLNSTKVQNQSTEESESSEVKRTKLVTLV